MILVKQITAIAPAFALVLPLLAMPVGSYAAGELDATSTPKCDTGEKWNFKEKKCLKPDAAKNDNTATIKKPAIKCFGKRIWDATAKKCVKEEKSSSIDQDSIYTHGRNLARAGQYENAIRVLYLAHDQNDPRVLNYLGYSNRKLGNMDKALTYYHAAVAANPDFSLVREYLGEAYIQLGQLEKAREQLTQIERICGTQNCREYAMLTTYMIDNQTK